MYMYTPPTLISLMEVGSRILVISPVGCHQRLVLQVQILQVLGGGGETKEISMKNIGTTNRII